MEKQKDFQIDGQAVTLPLNEIVVGDALAVLRTFPDESVSCIITSPPYLGLRDYSINGQIGLESTVEEYIGKLVEVFREARRVLHPLGTCWIVMGDSYAGSGCGGNAGKSGLQGTTDSQDESKVAKKKIGRVQTGFPGNRTLRNNPVCMGNMAVGSGIKRKDLIGASWELAFALRRDGWWLRQAIIWGKPGPIPESVLDRCTRSYETVFMLAKEERYFYDAWAIREPLSPASLKRIGQASFDNQTGGSKDYSNGTNANRSARGALENLAKKYRSGNKERKVATDGEDARTNTHLGYSVPWEDDGSGRNKRDVWTIPSEPMGWKMCGACDRVYSPREHNALVKDGDGKVLCRCGRADSWTSHYACFPQALVSPMILCGTSEKGCCISCGAPWRRVVKPTEEYAKKLGKGFHDHGSDDEQGMMQEKRDDLERVSAEYVSAGWEKTCKCETDEIRPAVVCDPFMGAGTVALVALRAGRDFVGIELSEKYATLARVRIAAEAQQGRMF